MKFQVITQVVLVVVAIAMVMFVIKPKLAEIDAMQAESAAYLQAIDKATQYNNKLAELVSKAGSISRADTKSLNTYIPDHIDALKVSQDIQALVADSGLILQNIEVATQNEPVTTSVDVSNAPVVDPALANDPGNQNTLGVGGIPGNNGSSLLDQAKRDMVVSTFDLTVLGSYTQFKALLMNLERNNYPLRMVDMSFDTTTESDLTQYTLTLETYALDAAAVANAANQ